MLAANIPETPRPRPPSKIRRMASLLKPATTPPPSYASAFPSEAETQPPLDTLLGSPMSATLQRVGWGTVTADGDRLLPLPSEDLEWMNETSREEISGLLVKADGLIKERENELEHASAVCKSLYDDNVALKTKHQALLARLPSSPSSPPSPELPSRTRSRYSISLSQTTSEFDSPSVPTPGYRSHTRKISMSTAEISHLADQNAELLEKLEKLESDSFSADQSGRRVLKKLEKEISVLREELEKTQAKSEELEEKAKVGWDSEKIVEEVLRKKRERELKLKAIRNLGHTPSEDEEDEEVRDFAPSSIFSFKPPEESFRRASGTQLKRSTLAKADPARSVSQPESSLISELLVKIQELEVANSRIIEQQEETINQLNSMKQETEHISKVYEYFGDENVIELASDVSEGDIASAEDTIRFGSFKRNLKGQMESSPSRRGGRSTRSLNISTGSKKRKSVVGLFDESEEGHEASSVAEPSNPLTSSSSVESNRTSLSVSNMGLISPALSDLSLSPSRPQELNSFDNPHPTLETELGNEFSNSWGLSNGSHHLRTSSLYDITQLSASPSPSPSRESLGHSHSVSHIQGAIPTLVSADSNALRLSVEPPTPDRVLITNEAGSTGKQSARYYRMSQTVRSRTNRWVDGRFGDTLPGPTMTGRTSNEEREFMMPLPLRLSNVFDTAVENVTGKSKEPNPRSPSLPNDDTTKLRVEKDKDKKPRGLSALMLEFWLWLQFAIIILAFIWTMAKRGPKSVLGEPSHRRLVSGSSRR